MGEARRGVRALAAAEALELGLGMSQENVDRTRDFIDAYNRRDFDAAGSATSIATSSGCFRTTSAQTRRSARRASFASGRGSTRRSTSFSSCPQEYVDAGDRVATRLRHAVRGKGSGLEMENELYHQVTTFRDGVIVRIEYVTTWEEALEAAGV